MLLLHWRGPHHRCLVGDLRGCEVVGLVVGGAPDWTNLDNRVRVEASLQLPKGMKKGAWFNQRNLEGTVTNSNAGVMWKSKMDLHLPHT